MSGPKDLIPAYRCPQCGSKNINELSELKYPCRQIRCSNCGYEGSPFAQPGDELTPEDDIVGYEWTCPSCGHHSYTIKSYNEPGDYHEGLGMTIVRVCTCCGYEV
jgi:predicted RNA-binding Zn-ribbon protein involved in translation (DUF1610 family)